MKIAELISDTLFGIGLPIAEKLYEGDDEEFITWNLADDIGADFGDNNPGTNTLFVQIHYVCPWVMDYHPKKRIIRQLLFDAGFTWPEITDVSDASVRMRHFVFECQIDNDYDLAEDYYV